MNWDPQLRLHPPASSQYVYWYADCPSCWVRKWNVKTSEVNMLLLTSWKCVSVCSEIYFSKTFYKSCFSLLLSFISVSLTCILRAVLCWMLIPSEEWNGVGEGREGVAWLALSWLEARVCVSRVQWPHQAGPEQLHSSTAPAKQLTKNSWDPPGFADQRAEIATRHHHHHYHPQQHQQPATISNFSAL